MKDYKSSSAFVSGLTPAVRTATVNGTGVDRSGANAVTHVLHVGVGGITFDNTNKVEAVLEHSDDNVAFAAVAANDAIADIAVVAGVFKAFVAAHAAAAAYAVGYRGGKRYSRVRLVFSGTHGTGTATASEGILGALSVSPAV